MPRTADQVFEELLAVRCRRGDLEAWDELVRRFSPRLLYYLGRFESRTDERGSLLQEVWLHALRGIGALRDERRLSAWLYTIAHRVVMSHFRHEYARSERTDGDLAVTHAAAGGDEFDRLDNAELVHHALSRIGWVEREALTLMFLEGLGVAEIAEVQRVPVGTVKSRLHRGRAELRSVIERTAGLCQGDSP